MKLFYILPLITRIDEKIITVEDFKFRTTLAFNVVRSYKIEKQTDINIAPVGNNELFSEVYN